MTIRDKIIYEMMTASMVFTVAMYGGIVLHDPAKYDNEYYIKSRSFVSPLLPDVSGFAELYNERLKIKQSFTERKSFPGNRLSFVQHRGFSFQRRTVPICMLEKRTK